MPASAELEPLPYYSYSSSYVPAPPPDPVPNGFGDGFYSYNIDQTAHEANLEHTPVGPFVDPFGVPGDYAEHLAVYGKHGDLSSRSRLPIRRVKFGGVGTYFCDTQV